jgi:serine protease Do
MKGLMTWILIVVWVSAIGIPDAAARSDCTEPIPELFRRVSPSVVFISAVAIDPFRLTDRVSSSIGSGFIISKEGLVLTNSHVVFGRRAIAVTLDDGITAPAELLGADPILDLAVLRIPSHPKGFPTAALGDSDAARVGEEVLAIGNPLGLEQTLTRGLVSGINRILPVSPMSLTLPLIQTDAAINPGNSGGPLLNRCGEVIGINTATLVGVQNIGFAVPINIAKRVLPQLVKEGRVIRPWLGVPGKLISRDLGKIINIPLVDGFLIETVEPGSPAQKAGLRGGELPIKIAGMEFLLGGDIITSANGQPLTDPENFAAFVRSLKVGDKVRLVIFREGKTRKVEFVLPERPILPGDLTPCDQRVFSPRWNSGAGY